MPSAANRLTVCASYCVNAPTVSGVRSANLPKPPRRMPRPSGSRLTAMPDARRKVHALDDAIAIGTDAQLEIQPIVDAPAVLGEDGELGAADFRVRRPRRVGRPLGERTVEPDDVELLAVVLAVEPRVLQVDADLEHVLAQPVDPSRASGASTTCRLRTLRSWRLKKLPLCPCGA